MTARVFDGTRICDQLFAELKDQIARLATEDDITLLVMADSSVERARH